MLYIVYLHRLCKFTGYLKLRVTCLAEIPKKVLHSETMNKWAI